MEHKLTVRLHDDDWHKLDDLATGNKNELIRLLIRKAWDEQNKPPPKPPNTIDWRDRKRGA